MQVLLNQIVLGPCVIAVVFAWNNLWLGKISELPNKYQKDALPTLFYGKSLIWSNLHIGLIKISRFHAIWYLSLFLMQDLGFGSLSACWIFGKSVFICIIYLLLLSFNQGRRNLISTWTTPMLKYKILTTSFLCYFSLQLRFRSWIIRNGFSPSL